MVDAGEAARCYSRAPEAWLALHMGEAGRVLCEGQLRSGVVCEAKAMQKEGKAMLACWGPAVSRPRVLCQVMPGGAIKAHKA